MEENNVTAAATVGTATPIANPSPIPASAPATETKPDYEALYKELVKEKDKLKTSFDTTSSDLARVKRELSEHRTKEENDKAEREESDRKLREELEALRNERRLTMYVNQLLGVGMDSVTAKALAETLPDNVPDNFFDGIKKFIADSSARIRAEALNSQPSMTTGMPASAADANAEADKALRKAFGLY